ncbi:hypothetical protein LINPERPRIM_LOCUS20381 [Linum perenne]
MESYRVMFFFAFFGLLFILLWHLRLRLEVFGPQKGLGF